MLTVTDSIARRNTLSAWAFEQSFKRKSSYFQELIDTVEFFRNQAQFVRADTVQLLRELEVGAVLYDRDDALPHIFTCIDNDDRVMLRDSGRVLLLAIDCDLNQIRDEIRQCLEYRQSSTQIESHDRLGTACDGQIFQSKLALEFA